MTLITALLGGLICGLLLTLEGVCDAPADKDLFRDHLYFNLQGDSSTKDEADGREPEAEIAISTRGPRTDGLAEPTVQYPVSCIWAAVLTLANDPLLTGALGIVFNQDGCPWLHIVS